MDACDVLIVGGGPAGSACASKLHAKGMDVLVLDKKTFPRDKTCAGWITPPVVDLLGVDLADYQRGRVLQPITGFRSGLVGGDAVETDYGRTVSYGIRRCEFDHYLLERSRARRRLGEPLQTLERCDGQWTINDQISAPLLVGAGGHFCPVARRLGARRDADASVVAAQEIEFELTPAALGGCGVRPEVPELYFCKDLAGYGWCFRKGNFLNIGMGRVDTRRLSSHVDDFCRFLRECRNINCEIPHPLHGHAYRLYERSLPKLVDDGVLLIGDAAGLAYPQSGEGIRPAVESGLMAAEVIVAAAGRDRQVDLEAYRSCILRRFGKPRTRGISDWLPAACLRFVAARLLATRWFSQRVVLDRWFLHTQEPPLGMTADNHSVSGTGVPPVVSRSAD